MVVKEEMIESEISKSAVLQDVSDELDLKAKKYLRGDGANLEVLQDKKLKGQLAVREKLYGQSAKAAAKAEKWLLPCEEGYLEGEGLEKTWRIKQEDILKEVDNNSSRKPFDMILPELGPYTLGYTTSGRYMMMGGRKGHLAMIDMISMDLIKEFQVRETVRDVVFLQNDQFFAVAQKKYPYIYNRHGTEIHCLKTQLQQNYEAALADCSDESTASTQASLSTFGRCTRVGMSAPKGTRTTKKSAYSTQLEEQLKNMNEQRDADRERIRQLEQTQKNMEESQKAMQDLLSRFMSSQPSGGQAGWSGASGGQAGWGGAGGGQAGWDGAGGSQSAWADVVAGQSAWWGTGGEQSD